MIDIQLIRKNMDWGKEQLVKVNDPEAPVDAALEMDTRRRGVFQGVGGVG